VSDVSCIGGQCRVHRCNPGYVVHPNSDSCVYTQPKEPILLAAQFGLEHVPLGEEHSL
jgi:hypothetical protein